MEAGSQGSGLEKVLVAVFWVHSTMLSAVPGDGSNYRPL